MPSDGTESRTGLGSGNSGSDGSSNALPMGLVRSASVDGDRSLSGDAVVDEGAATEVVVTCGGVDGTVTWSDSPEEAAPQAAMKRARATKAMVRDMGEWPGGGPE